MTMDFMHQTCIVMKSYMKNDSHYRKTTNIFFCYTLVIDFLKCLYWEIIGTQQIAHKIHHLIHLGILKYLH